MTEQTQVQKSTEETTEETVQPSQPEDTQASDTEKNKNVFDEIDEAADTAQEASQASNEKMVDAPDDGDDFEEDELEDIDFSVNVSDESPQEREERIGKKIKKPSGTVLTVKEVGFTKPKLYTMQNDKRVRVEPKKTVNAQKPYYPIKLRVRFEEDNLVEYYPSINVWVNEGKLNPNVKIHRTGNNKVSQLFRLVVNHMANNKFTLYRKNFNNRMVLVVKDEDKKAFNEFAKTVTDKQFMEYLVGKKIKTELVEGNYKDRDWFRNDIKEIVDTDSGDSSSSEKSEVKGSTQEQSA